MMLEAFKLFWVIVITCLYPWPFPCPAGLLRLQRGHWKQVLDQETLSLPRTQSCFEAIEGDPALEYNLPKKPGMLAGQVLKHCYSVVDQMLSAQWPCIWKVGYTHDAFCRFYNSKFGYKHDRAQWSNMVVIHASSESVSSAYIEAAIIHRHLGFLIAKNGQPDKPLVFIKECSFMSWYSFFDYFLCLLRTTRISKWTTWRRIYPNGQIGQGSTPGISGVQILQAPTKIGWDQKRLQKRALFHDQSLIFYIPTCPWNKLRLLQEIADVKNEVRSQ